MVKTKPVRKPTTHFRALWHHQHMDEMKHLTIRQRAFLKAYSEEFTVKAASAKIGIAMTDHTFWMTSATNSALYKRLFDDLRDNFIEALEGEAFRRAYNGVEETVYYQGEACGVKTNYSDALLMFLLRAANPEKYRERSQMDMNIKPVDADINPAFRSISVEAIRKIRMVVEEDQLKNRLIENGDQEQKSA